MVEHTHTVISQVHLAQRLLLDQETGLRGLILTRAPEFLEPYTRAAVLSIAGVFLVWYLWRLVKFVDQTYQRALSEREANLKRKQQARQRLATEGRV